MRWFPGGLVLEAHRLVYHSTPGLRVMKKKKFFFFLLVCLVSTMWCDPACSRAKVDGLKFLSLEDCPSMNRPSTPPSARRCTYRLHYIYAGPRCAADSVGFTFMCTCRPCCQETVYFQNPADTRRCVFRTRRARRAENAGWGRSPRKTARILSTLKP